MCFTGCTILDAARAYAGHLATNSETLDDADLGNNQQSENDGQADLSVASMATRLPISINENLTSAKLLGQSLEDTPSHRPGGRVLRPGPGHHVEKPPQPLSGFDSGDDHKARHPSEPAGSGPSLAYDSRFGSPTGANTICPFEAQHGQHPSPTEPRINLHGIRFAGQPTSSSHAFNATPLRTPSGAGPACVYDARAQGHPTHVFQDHVFGTPILTTTAGFGQGHADAVRQASEVEVMHTHVPLTNFSEDLSSRYNANTATHFINATSNNGIGSRRPGL